MSDDFYRAFEDRHRGSREQIKDRQAAYLPFIRPWLAVDPEPISLDLGCGRGEWLELMSQEGFHACGVDQDEGMLEACRTLGLKARKDDALAALRELKDESLSVVSAFHVIEHIDFETLVALVRESHRVLRPGGILILETPNPENLIVAGCNFYLDPSHRNPVPPELLSFAVEYAGFNRLKQLRLQESERLRDPEAEVRLLDVLGGVSPDYAVVSQKACDPAFAQSFDAAFGQEYGLRLVELADRFEARFPGGQAQRLADEVAQLSRKYQDLESQAKQTKLEFDECIRQSNAAVHQMHANLQAVYGSTSWRVTAPLRWSMDKARAVWRRAKPTIKPWVQKGAMKAHRYPWIRRLADRLLRPMPGLRQRVAGFMAVASVQVSNIDVAVKADDLTPRARGAYEALHSAMARRNGRNKKENP